jgi:hypothetical protein
MPRSFGVVFVVALAMWALLGMLVSDALANHVTCGDVITTDTTLDSDLLDCPGHGIVIGAPGITLDLNGHTVDGDGDPRPPHLGCDTGEHLREELSLPLSLLMPPVPRLEWVDGEVLAAKVPAAQAR